MRRLIGVLNAVGLASTFVLGPEGRRSGIGAFAKMRLLLRIYRNCKRIPSHSNWRQHVILAREVLAVPPDVPGDVVECGCFSGASTAALSLACAMAGRRLWVCDSFEGLPPPRADEVLEVPPGLEKFWRYSEGDLASIGGIEGVKANVAKHGALQACEFVKGFFADTLPGLAASSIVLVFEDADLPSAVEDCLEHLWPKLRPGCRFYCHEPWSPGVVAVFYDKSWWQAHLGAAPPGFHGSGWGTIEFAGYSWMGYARKTDPSAEMEGRTELELHHR